MITVPEGQRWEEVSALLLPGGVSTYHHLVFHDSGPNQSDRPRRSLAIHMHSEGSRPADGGSHLPCHPQRSGLVQEAGW